jgi:hypothetical protein
MKPQFISHESYQNFILQQLQIHYADGILVLVNNDWSLIFKLWLTDLSYVSTWLYDSYSTKGPHPRDPSAMMRSYLIFLLTRPTIGITAWVDEFHRVPLYAILSNFKPGNIPGVVIFMISLHIYGTVKILMKNLKKSEKAPPKKVGYY